MPNVASVLKEEIARIARKATRAELDSMKATNARYRSEIVELKRRFAALEGELKRLARSVSARRDHQHVGEDAGKLRFRHDGLSSHRRRLGLSAAAFGTLIGVSGLTIYNWESGKTKPRASQLPAIAAVRKMGKKESAAILAKAKGQL